MSDVTVIGTLVVIQPQAPAPSVIVSQQGPPGTGGSGGGGLTDGDKGDIVVSGGGTALNIDANVLGAFGRSLIDDADAATARVTLGAAATGHTHAIADITGLQTALDGKQVALGYTAENAANKGVANGYAGLDGTGKVPAAQLPSFVDDVLEFANLAGFPGTGAAGVIYVALDTNKTWRWGGSSYVEISPSPGSTDSVTEGATNLYFTSARVLATVLTGFASGANTAIAATDTLLAALGKVQAQITAQALAGAVTASGITMTSGRILARTTAATGAIEELTFSQLLDMIGSAAQGDILFRGASNWARLGAGTAGQALLSGGAGANPAWGSASGSDPLTLTQAPAASPAATAISEGMVKHAGMNMEAVTHPLFRPFYPHFTLARHRLSGWVGGFGLTVLEKLPGSFVAPSLLGTGTVRSFATTNYFTQQSRTGIVSAATAASMSGFYQNGTGTRHLAVGGSNAGGFRAFFQFGCSDAASVSGARQFVGLANDTTAATNVDPASLTNVIGLGVLAGSSNMQIVFGGSSPQTPIDLGANFPANTLSTDWYELILFSDRNDNTKVWYRVTRMNTGDVADGSIPNTTPGTTLPSTSTLLAVRAWRTNNATALAVGLDIGLAVNVPDF